MMMVLNESGKDRFAIFRIDFIEIGSGIEQGFDPLVVGLGRLQQRFAGFGEHRVGGRTKTTPAFLLGLCRAVGMFAARIPEKAREPRISKLPRV
jgi:hypothetical protein